MTESPQEMPGVPPDEDVNEADVADRLAEDPERVPNAPNRDPRDGEGSAVVPPDPQGETDDSST